uniref:uncharacterized protein LOC118525383 n=1 Tax=Halichoerus grypus TaxID=9711 RepID=UPI001659773C|nr:uncharacterized protein LOC118525383 [Halichoerus grypus]
MLVAALGTVCLHLLPDALAHRPCVAQGLGPCHELPAGSSLSSVAWWWWLWRGGSRVGSVWDHLPQTLMLALSMGPSAWVAEIAGEEERAEPHPSSARRRSRRGYCAVCVFLSPHPVGCCQLVLLDLDRLGQATSLPGNFVMSLRVSLVFCRCLFVGRQAWCSGCPCPCLGAVRTLVWRVPEKLRVGVDRCRSEVWGALLSESPGHMVPDIALRACGVLAHQQPPSLFPRPLCPFTTCLTSALLATTGLASGPVLQSVPCCCPQWLSVARRDLTATVSAWHSRAPAAFVLDPAELSLGRPSVLPSCCVSRLCLCAWPLCLPFLTFRILGTPRPSCMIGHVSKAGKWGFFGERFSGTSRARKPCREGGSASCVGQGSASQVGGHRCSAS